jgi:hypothetical protein
VGERNGSLPVCGIHFVSEEAAMFCTRRLRGHWEAMAKGCGGGGMGVTQASRSGAGPLKIFWHLWAHHPASHPTDRLIPDQIPQCVSAVLGLFLASYG